MDKPKFRIMEFVDADDDGNRFFVQMGTKFKEQIWWIFYRSKTKWEDIKMKGEDKPLGRATFSDAVEDVKRLQRQIPTYHNIK